MSARDLTMPLRVTIKHVYSKEELQTLAETIVNYDVQLIGLEKEIADTSVVLSRLKKQGREIEVLRKQKSTAYELGYEDLTYECDVEEDFLNNVINYIDVETGEVVKQDKMGGMFEPSERQDENAPY